MLVARVGWRATFQILGTAFFAMTMIGTALLRNPPAGYRPPNWTPARAITPAGYDMSAREMLRTPTFYALWIAFCLGTTAGLMTISQLVPFARAAGLGATAATYAITVGAFGNAGGRIVSGWMSDTLGRVRTLRAMVSISAAATPALFLWREHVLPFYLLVAIVYWCYGTQISLFATTTADFYGTRHLGMNYGVLFTAWGAAGILGPAIAARAYDRFGDYRYAFFAAAALAVVALAALSFARAPASNRLPEASGR
jgi:OFA family oxalate/formate antiporter-like MFS transporter